MLMLEPSSASLIGSNPWIVLRLSAQRGTLPRREVLLPCLAACCVVGLAANPVKIGTGKQAF